MNLLIDTHILLWWLDDSDKLSNSARKRIQDQHDIVFVSVATVWEISIKKALGKLVIPDDFKKALEASGFQILPISFEHAELAGALPRHHDDPFDRMLIAQSKLENLLLLTHDKSFQAYQVNLCLN
jgi:PIN domain nuclease of toxin-antitoxin system